MTPSTKSVKFLHLTKNLTSRVSFSVKNGHFHRKRWVLGAGAVDAAFEGFQTGHRVQVLSKCETETSTSYKQVHRITAGSVALDIMLVFLIFFRR
jgi:hypothetical protein